MNQKGFLAFHDFLQRLRPGMVVGTDREALLFHLRELWGYLDGEHKGSLTVEKVDRMEQPEWNPPHVTFLVERHGGIGQGSSRAEIQMWTYNAATKRVDVADGGYRQKEPRARPLNVTPLVEDVLALIRGKAQDDQIRWLPNGNVRVVIGKVIPKENVPRETLAGRRRRFREKLIGTMQENGWLHVNLYEFQSAERAK